MGADKSGRPKTGLPRNVWAVTITSFLTDISSEMLFNLLPLFLFNVIGTRNAVIDLIEGIAETAASLFKLSVGGGIYESICSSCT